MEAKFTVLEHFSAWFHLLRYPVGLGLLFLALVCGHLYLPAKRPKFRRILPGILITILLWLFAAWGYGEYTARFSRAHAMYAGLGNIVIALVFVYISALVVILGGEINQALLMRHKENTKNN
ncbi:MAG: YihY/virulence factor BrkB family protein [Candidatus Marinimicrobia bacterium]|nr:YihY/virulence factor BrkB family protein [Candidatus Neomarinimicrobiota bacterium]